MFTALAIALLGAAPVPPARAETWLCPDGTFRVELVTDTLGEIHYLNDLVLCQNNADLGSTLYNKTDMAWYPSGPSDVEVYPGPGAATMYHLATEEFATQPYTYILPGDQAWISDHRYITWNLDMDHSSGWLVAERLYEETLSSSLAAAEYLTSGSGKSTKAVWECTEGAAEVGIGLMDDRIDGEELVDLALDVGTGASDCKKAWDTARKSKVAKKAKLPTYANLSKWLHVASDVNQISDDITSLTKLCGVLGRFCPVG